MDLPAPGPYPPLGLVAALLSRSHLELASVSPLLPPSLLMLWLLAPAEQAVAALADRRRD